MPNKSFELRRCSNYRKLNYRESTVLQIQIFCFYKAFCASWLSTWFLKRENILKKPSNKYWSFLSLSMIMMLSMILGSIILKMNGWVPSDFFLPNSRAWKAKANQDKRPSYVDWPAPREGKVLWKPATKIKVSLAEKKVLYFKESIILNLIFNLYKRRYHD